MVAARLRPSHRVRQASGPSRPATLTLTEFWTTFDPTEPALPCLRFRSAPWDDILDVPEDDSPPSSDTADVPEVPEDTQSDFDTASVDSLQLDSPTLNVLGKPPPPTHYKELDLHQQAPQIPLLDPIAHAILRSGVHLPPPTNPVPVFHST
jgi:hypothetical protein